MKRVVRFVAVCAAALPFWFGAIVYPVQNLTGRTPLIPEMKQFGPFGTQDECGTFIGNLQALYQHGNDGAASAGCWNDATPTPTPTP